MFIRNIMIYLSSYMKFIKKLMQQNNKLVSVFYHSSIWSWWGILVLQVGHVY